VLLLNECMFLLLFISLSTQSGNFWIHRPMYQECKATRMSVMRLEILCSSDESSILLLRRTLSLESYNFCLASAICS
jgi:hypothetical protein